MDPQLFDHIFPFNFHLTANNRVGHAGPSLIKLLPDDPNGMTFGRLVDLDGVSGFDPDAQHTHWVGNTVSFSLLEPAVRLTGSFVADSFVADSFVADGFVADGTEHPVIFVGTIGPEEVPRLAELGLTGDDFAPHDLCLEQSRTLETAKQIAAQAEEALADLEATRLLKDALHHKAHTDELTQVANRSAFVDYLGKAVARPDDPTTQLAVMIVDIDRFKSINDLYGHLAGDETLRIVANHLTEAVGEAGLVARLGGDEFGILVPALPIEEDLSKTIDRIVSIRGRTFRVDTANVEINITLGVVIQRTEKTGNDLLRHADIAMYEARRSHQQPVNIFSPAARRNLAIRRAIRIELPDAIEKNEIDIVYQPEVDLRTGFATRLEAFVRWNHSEFGTINTSMFIDEVERCQMSQLLHRYVLRRATTDALQHFTVDGAPIGINVNLSPLSITPNLATDVDQALGLSGFPPDQLILEVAEIGTNLDMDRIAAILHELVEIGVTIAIDDFGTGHSSLKNLSQFPIGALKMDGSFTSSVSTSRKALELVQATLQICQLLDLPVVAEGVETAQHAQLFQGMGFEYGQGYHFGRPSLLQDIVGILGRPLPLQRRRSTDGKSPPQDDSQNDLQNSPPPLDATSVAPAGHEA